MKKNTVIITFGEDSRYYDNIGFFNEPLLKSLLSEMKYHYQYCQNEYILLKDIKIYLGSSDIGIKESLIGFKISDFFEKAKVIKVEDSIDYGIILEDINIYTWRLINL